MGEMQSTINPMSGQIDMIGEGLDALTEAEADLLYVRRDGTTNLTANWDADESIHVNDSEDLSAGNTAASPDVRMSSDGTTGFLEWVDPMSGSAITPHLELTTASFSGGALKYPALKFEGGVADGSGFIDHTIWVWDTAGVADGSLIVGGSDFALISGHRFQIAVDTVSDLVTLVAFESDLKIQAGTTGDEIQFFIVSTQEVAIAANTMTFNSGSTDPVLDWSTDGQLALTTGTFRVDDKVVFTQTDGNEYWDSLTDGELDGEATTAINFRINGTEQVQVLDGSLTGTAHEDIDFGILSGTTNRKFRRMFLEDPWISEDFHSHGSREQWFTTVGLVGFSWAVSGEPEGEIFISTSTTNDAQLWKPTREQLAAVDHNSIIEMRVKISAITGIHVRFGLSADGANASAQGMLFKADSDDGDTTWQCITADADSSEIDDSGTTPDTNYHTYRIELTTTSVTYFIDDAQVAQSTDTADIDTRIVGFYFGIQTRTTAARTITVDYFKVWQDR